MSKLAFRISVLTVIVIAAAAVLPAATINPSVTCQSLIVTTGVTTLSALLGMDSLGCISQDKIFSNFQYSGSVAASAVNATIVLKTGLGPDTHGWAFNPETAWTGVLTLSYDMTVASGFPLLAIVQSKDQINTGQIPNGITMTDTQSGVLWGGLGSVTMSGTQLGGGSTNESKSSDFYNLKTVHTSSVGTIPVNQSLLSYEQDWTEGSSVPEPMSFVLIGTGLLGLGLLRRRVRR